jgi:hypothetical protein
MVGARPLSELANTNGAEEPLLSGFQMHYLPPLSGDDIAQLVTCAGAEVGFVLNDRVALISQHTGGHPFLAQGLCLRLFDGSSWEQAYYAVISHASLQYAFKQDYQFLSEGERQVVHAVSAAGTLSEGGVFVALPRHLLTDRGRQQFLDGLTQSGYLVTEAGSYRLANTFFADWLKDSAATLSSLG